ncbi:MAG: DUF2809 domain-containing protein [Chloroflexota bacterium]
MKLQKESLTMRHRIIYGIAIIITMLVGLFSRSDIVPMPQFVFLYVGDGIWALLVFWLACFLRPDWPLKYRVAAALAFAYAIEFSQFYQADWLNQIRQTRLGGLVLGFSFLPSDLVAYTIGIAVGTLLDYLFRSKWDTKLDRSHG